MRMDQVEGAPLGRRLDVGDRSRVRKPEALDLLSAASASPPADELEATLHRLGFADRESRSGGAEGALSRNRRLGARRRAGAGYRALREILWRADVRWLGGWR